MDERELFEPASTQYDDLKGTAALDTQEGSLDALGEMAGLDLTEWSVLAVELSGGEGSSGGALLATRRAGTGPDHDWRAVAAANEYAVPVTRFLLPRQEGSGVLRTFKCWSIHATTRSTVRSRGLTLEVVDTVEDAKG